MTMIIIKNLPVDVYANPVVVNLTGVKFAVVVIGWGPVLWYWFPPRLDTYVTVFTPAIGWGCVGNWIVSFCWEAAAAVGCVAATGTEDIYWGDAVTFGRAAMKGE